MVIKRLPFFTKNLYILKPLITKITIMIKKILALCLASQVVCAGPWMTGPLLAPAGKTIPKGHVNFEPYGFYSVYPQGFKNLEGVPIISIGVLDFLDLQTTVPFDYSWQDHTHGGGVGDFSLAVGLQVLRQQDNGWLPDFRFVLQEVFPTGKFENLDPRKGGTDQTGIGTYHTFFGFNFQRLTQFQNDHYLRTRLSLVGATATDVKVHGVNAFGGTPDTEGRVHPGNSYSADLAFEYSLTQNWVPVFEVLYARSAGSNFVGNPGFTPGGTLASIGGSGAEQTSLAPALEYNFSPTLGIIGGVWFSVSGPSAGKFTTAAIAINYII